MKLIDPFDYIETTNPEAHSFLIESGMNLGLETELMVARAAAQGRPYRLHEDGALIPQSICAAVIEGASDMASMRAEIETLTGRPAVY